MASDLFNQMENNNGINGIMQAVNQLKSRGGDPDQMIQQMLNSGRISQSQYNSAMQKAQQIMRMMGK